MKSTLELSAVFLQLLGNSKSIKKKKKTFNVIPKTLEKAKLGESDHGRPLKRLRGRTFKTW